MSSNDKKDAAAAGQPAKMSSQMQAVVRLLTGQEERTIAQKLADSNRPTWEQYKKENEDKLNLDGVDQKKMEEYRQQLDAEREKILARGTNHKADKKKSSKSKSKHRRDDSDGDSSDEERHRRRKHKKKKKKHRKRHRRDNDDSDSSDDDSRSENSSYEDRKRRHKRRKKSKKKRSSGDTSDHDSDGSHYRLSKFFQGSGDSE
eukprot:Nitzschia sp. Nitz4//scaffold5_size260463//203785//204393//NITZ4_001012-RA/size260463-processed-gene-0.142-mRNA-1//-1//CDS//3329555430//3355//frame0